jgi:hypothetical protein
MQTTEKIALLYLRFNGFFTMPHFTVFGDKGNRHVDILGVRLEGSEEKVGKNVLCKDDLFIEKVSENNQSVFLWAEVGNRYKGDEFVPTKEEYCKRIFGNKGTVKKVYFDFDKSGDEFSSIDGVLIVPGSRCGSFIIQRFSQMASEPVKGALDGLSKTGSWVWSEDFLADLLYLKKLGLLKEK